jgi:glycosyltransferase involved in cell wall biosynthesis
VIKDYNLKHVTCFGFAKDSTEIAKLINESRVLIMLSYNEGGPRVVLEALACGIPVIATPVGIVEDVIKKDNGRIIGWSADEAIRAFEAIKNIKATTGVSQFEKKETIKNYADKLKNIIQIYE